MSTFKDMIELASSAEEGDRQRKQANRMSVYIDDFFDKVEALIKLQFHSDNANRLYKMTATFANLLKKVVNLKSVIYKNPAIREWGTEEGEPDKSFEEMNDGTNINLSFQTLNKYININNTSFMRVKSDIKNKKLVYEAVPSENMCVLRNEDDPFQVDAILHKIVLDSQTTFYHYWDKDEYVRVNSDFKPVDRYPNQYKDPNTNEGLIPYIPVWAFQPIANSFWNETINEDLYAITLQTNVHLTHLNNLIKQSAYKQLYFSNLNAEDIKRMYDHVTDSVNPIALTGEGAEAGTLELTHDVNKLFETIHDLASQVLDQHGIHFQAQVKSGIKQSGLALTIEKEELDNMREEQEPILIEGEKKIAYVAVIVSNTDLKTNIDVNKDLKITFQRDEVEFTPEDVAVTDWKTNNGYKKKTDIFMVLNPSVTDETTAENDMKEAINKNQELAKLANPTPEAPGDEELDDAFNQQDVRG